MISVTTTKVIGPKDNATRSAEWRARNPEKNKAKKAENRRKHSRWVTNAKYLSRPFIAWDGEGITLPDGRHVYVLLAMKGGGHSADVFDERGLGTAQLFEFILKNAKEVSGGIHVFYGGGYDFNMMLRDVPVESLRKLYAGAYVHWQGYRMMWRKGKSFYLSRLNANGKAYDKVTLYDCAPFFQRPFVEACDSYLGDAFYRRDLVVKNKALRSSFTNADIEEVREYNDVELTNLIRLMEELRERLNKCYLRPKRWDGPGAVASALLKREKVQEAMAECPEGPARAARFAYAGGRFEVLKFGSVTTDVWEYDIRSAYPAALRNVPNLNAGKWRHVKGDAGPKPFALYHVEYRGKNARVPGAFFRRDKNGTISYPMAVTGWYWSPEVETGREYCKRGYGEMRVIETWVFEEAAGIPKPFAFIDPLYKMRQEFKAAGDGAHVGIKLGLNSLYGKLAQQIGARQNITGEWDIPPFHQIEWAGYTTSYCRAKILGACLDNLESVIAFETDAVFVDSPLNVPLNDELGNFDMVEFSKLTYIQSGMYFGISNGKVVERTRGIDRNNVHESDAIAAMQMPRADDRYIPSQLTRFTGLGIALMQGMEKWQRWTTSAKRVNVEPTGKRVHLECDCDGYGLELERWHYTICPFLNDAHSEEFPIEWINPNPDMSALEELRHAEHVWD